MWGPGDGVFVLQNGCGFGRGCVPLPREICFEFSSENAGFYAFLL